MDEDDDDVESYFAYSSDDMLPSKLTSTANSDSSILNSTGVSQLSEATIPNFLLKLWKLVEDGRYSQCIEWDSTGFSFHVREPYGFSKDVLPLYFKHSNLNSFIRQLNMYGFRKVTNLEKGALKQQTELDSLEFQHPYFVRGHPELLQYIKRKVSNPRAGSELDVQHSNSARGLNQVLGELRQLREKQFGMDAKLNHVKKENGTLWREVAHMRQLHMKQQQIVNKLIQFLLSLVQPAAGKRLGKRQLLAIGPSLLADQQREECDERPAKRVRSDSIKSQSSAAHIIESLEQELQCSDRLSFVTSIPTNTTAGSGPIIADVTDDPEHYDLDGQIPQTSSINEVPATVAKQPFNVSGVPISFGQVTTTLAENGGSGLALGLNSIAPSQAHDNLLAGSSGGHRLYQANHEKFGIVAQSTAPMVPCQAVLPPMAPQQTDSTQLTQKQQPRALLNRSISDGDGTLYDWNFRANPVSDGDNNKWSKPEFSDYLDFVQTDLDSLKDFLTSTSFDVDQDSLTNLFTIADESNTAAGDSSQVQGSDIVGNEVQLHKQPEAQMTPNNQQYGVSTSNRSTGSGQLLTVLSAGAPLMTPPITVSSSGLRPRPASYGQIQAATAAADQLLPGPVVKESGVRPISPAVGLRFGTNVKFDHPVYLSHPAPRPVTTLDAVNLAGTKQKSASFTARGTEDKLRRC